MNLQPLKLSTLPLFSLLASLFSLLLSLFSLLFSLFSPLSSLFSLLSSLFLGVVKHLFTTDFAPQVPPHKMTHAVTLYITKNALKPTLH